MSNTENRKMKVYSGSDKSYKPVAQIRIQGRWLEELGFVPGTPIEIKCKNGKLTIVKTS